MGAMSGPPMWSVPFALVDEGQERPAVGEAAEVLAERRDGAPGPPRRAAGRVRRHHHTRMAPERMAGRQRLGIRDVEPGAPDEPPVQRRHQILALNDLAAPDADPQRVAL